MYSRSSVLGLALAFAAPGVAQQDGGLPAWLWLLIILGVVLLVLLLVFLIRWLGRSEAPARPMAAADQPEVVEAVPVKPEVIEAETEALAPDDLEIIEGIGPKIARVLGEHGIVTFSQLAEAGVDRLHQIMLDEGLRLADPGTWPEQARLAAAGDMDGLAALQDRLKGGRGA